MQLHKFRLRLKANLLLILVIIVGGCQFLDLGNGSNVVEIIVPKGELDVWGAWALSPEGDKIAYRGKEHTIILFPATKQNRQIDSSCYSFNWLDNAILHCGARNLISADDFGKISIKEVQAAEVDLEDMLSEAGRIYRRTWDLETIIVLHSDYQQNPDKNFWIKDVEDIEAVLQGYKYITVPVTKGSTSFSDGKVYSPDGHYYYSIDRPSDTLTIYVAENDEKVAEFNTKGYKGNYNIQAKGWTADSSGVYFQVVLGPGLNMNEGRYIGIRKLKVPQ